MKKKLLNKKLGIKKETVSNLENIRGGAGTTIISLKTCISFCITSCIQTACDPTCCGSQDMCSC